MWHHWLHARGTEGWVQEVLDCLTPTDVRGLRLVCRAARDVGFTKWWTGWCLGWRQGRPVRQTWGPPVLRLERMMSWLAQLAVPEEVDPVGQFPDQPGRALSTHPDVLRHLPLHMQWASWGPGAPEVVLPQAVARRLQHLGLWMWELRPEYIRWEAPMWGPHTGLGAALELLAQWWQWAAAVRHLPRGQVRDAVTVAGPALPDGDGELGPRCSVQWWSIEGGAASLMRWTLEDVVRRACTSLSVRWLMGAVEAISFAEDGGSMQTEHRHHPINAMHEMSHTLKEEGEHCRATDCCRDTVETWLLTNLSLVRWACPQLRAWVTMFPHLCQWGATTLVRAARSPAAEVTVRLVNPPLRVPVGNAYNVSFTERLDPLGKWLQASVAYEGTGLCVMLYQTHLRRVTDRRSYRLVWTHLAGLLTGTPGWTSATETSTEADRWWAKCNAKVNKW